MTHTRREEPKTPMTSSQKGSPPHGIPGTRAGAKGNKTAQRRVCLSFEPILGTLAHSWYTRVACARSVAYRRAAPVSSPSFVNPRATGKRTDSRRRSVDAATD